MGVDVDRARAHAQTVIYPAVRDVSAATGTAGRLCGSSRRLRFNEFHRFLGFELFRIADIWQYRLDEWLQPTPVGVYAIRVPSLHRGLDASDVLVGEVKLLRRQRKI